MAEAGIDSVVLATAAEQLVGQRWGLRTDYDPRALPHDARGSNDVNGPDPMHGTHVAGIIGAVATSDATVRGIAPYVTIMPLRAVPDGDERDDEVARAIRYAVDNGAQVVNMSFGKGYSPGKPAVDSAVRYAAQKGVLLVHAAGNDGADNDTVPSFPSRRLGDGSETPLWLEIGASSWKGGADLPAEFSNYGAKNVDLFAPGVDIVSTVPGGKVAPESGTSMAAPVVSGVAALLLSYFPSLTPAQVRGIIVETARPLRDLEVTRPGDDSGRSVRFGTLSRTGGVIDAYAAVQRAIELAKPLP
jgi:subtilisin family serine protease